MCIDYRAINARIARNVFPLRRISEVIVLLGEAKAFRSLDLSQGYHQMQMAPNDNDKIAFSIFGAHYEFTKLLFDIVNTPASFQRLMHQTWKILHPISCWFIWTTY